MAKKIVKKLSRSQRAKPISKRTDWAKMKKEIAALHLRLQCQMPGEFSLPAPNSVMNVLIAFLAGELDFCSAEQKIRELSTPDFVLDRSDWVHLKMEIKERIERLMQRPESERRQEFRDLEMLFVGVMFGEISVGIAADKAREMLKPPPFDENTPEQILIAYSQKRCSLRVAEALINQLIAEAKSGE